MPRTTATVATEENRFEFGYEVMGPILAECCHRLQDFLANDTPRQDHAVALYCARGGLTIRRALELYQSKTGQPAGVVSKDLMASRLAASRLALVTHAETAAPLLDLEFEGRSCADVARVLSGLEPPGGDGWTHPYSLDRLLDLLDGHDGSALRDSMHEQAALLREHVMSLVGPARTVYLIDTGVFGSIGCFLAAGIPGIDLRSTLLFQANYKKSKGLPLPRGIGLICSESDYKPWQVRTASRLYWPFIESFFEPDLPSVRTFRRVNDRVVSNLQIPGWRDKLPPRPKSLLAGAFAYLEALQPGSVNDIPERADNAWTLLRRRIVYPSRNDVTLLGVPPRSLDFGFDAVVTFGDPAEPKKRRIAARVRQIRASLWPEGEVRRQFPGLASPLLTLLELGRYASALFRSIAGSR